VTIHPDKMSEWSDYYPKGIKIKEDSGNIWTDGEIGGYCTEFFSNGVEIGNIVNPNGDCIDVGFGLDRLQRIIDETDLDIIPEDKSLINAINEITKCGYKPSNTKQGYVLRKLLRRLWKIGGVCDNEFFEKECERQNKLATKYGRLKDKHSSKSKEWWFDTHGIDVELM